MIGVKKVLVVGAAFCFIVFALGFFSAHLNSAYCEHSNHPICTS